ncbi:hypothetical protein ABPG75_007245 [Micractinium tetrahymenae]
MAAESGSPGNVGYSLLPENEPSGPAAAAEPLGRRRSTLRPLSLPPGLHLSSGGSEHTAVQIPSDHEAAVAQRLLWHAQHQAPACLTSLQASREGLTEREATERLRKHGPNAIAARGPAAWYSVLWHAFWHPFNAILLLLAGVSFLTADLAAAAIMLVMVTASTALRFWQELKSTVAAARLAEMMHTRAAVIRLDEQTGLPVERLVDQRTVVPGDCVRLYAGEMMPGDVRLLQARDLFAGQAALTGEAMPVEKSARAACRSGAAPPPLLECRCLGFTGTHVVSGTGLGLVIATGNSTYISTLADQLSRQKPPNAFQRGVQRVSWLLIAFMAAMVPLVVACNGLMTGDWAQAALFGISVAVGLTPEMLPMVVNANLARGAVAMAKQRTIVKRLDAVQNLGAMDILCTDKTGTLTQDQVVLTRWLDWRGAKSPQALSFAFLNAFFQTGSRNLLDAAILGSGKAAGLEGEAERFERLDELPFDFVRRRLSVVLQGEGGPPLLVCKGAVEETVGLCCSVQAGQETQPLDDRGRDELLALGERLNADGLRVLAVAVRELPSVGEALAAATAIGDGASGAASGNASPRCPGWEAGSSGAGAAAGLAGAGGSEGGEASPSAPPTPLARQQRPASPHGGSAASLASLGIGFSADDEAGMCFVGFLAFLDPPKETARQAVAELHAKSVALKVLTGDSLEVARHVCRQVGIPADRVTTGPALAKLGAAEFVDAARQASVIGKLTPAQKARVVAALKDARHTVGFLGDGINDALALRTADVGISVDTGSDIAKDAADVILLEKSLLVLEHGVVQGRETHGNTIKYIKMAASSNFGNVFSVLIASACLPFQPMRPIQLLTQNLLYDLSQTAIPFDTMDASYLAVPRGWSASSLLTFMLCIGPISSIFDVTTFALLWFVYGANNPERQALFQTGWFTVGIVTQILIVHLIRTERIPFLQEVAAWPVVLATLLVAAVGLALPYTPIGRVERMAELPPSFYAWVTATMAGYMLAVQLAKWLYKKAFRSWL